jgi:hypothetical protein
MTEIWQYDLTTQIWALLPSNGLYLVTNSQIVHVAAASDVSSSTNIYLYGGIYYPNGQARFNDRLFVYDLASMSWSKLRYIKQKAKT